jgi:hypothetical protein
MRRTWSGGTLLILAGCMSGANDCDYTEPPETCKVEGGTCGDGLGPGCDPATHHVDYDLSCRPTVGAQGKLGAVCCLPGAPPPGDAGVLSPD